MVVHFSGTGNSAYAAEKLCKEGEALISIADALKTGKLQYEGNGSEAAGFVFPVYFYTVPTIVRTFIEKLDLRNVSYVYGVITCGGSIGQAGSVLKKLLQNKGLILQYVKPVLMPDNSMLFYQIPGVEGAEERIRQADEVCREIAAAVEKRTVMNISDNTVISSLMDLGYQACSKTKKFHADERCISCGLCESVCPEAVIHLENGKPVWTKDTCSKCSACINRCPKRAIQYGRGTAKRNRYVNPYSR